MTTKKCVGVVLCLSATYNYQDDLKFTFTLAMMIQMRKDRDLCSLILASWSPFLGLLAQEDTIHPKSALQQNNGSENDFFLCDTV